MALFDNNAQGFIDSLQNIDKSGIVDLTREVENLTKATSEYEKAFNESFQKGEALTKRQKNAYREIDDSIKATIDAQKTLRQAIDATNDAWKKAPKNSAEKKELSGRIDAYRQLQKAVETYKQSASSAVSVGAKVYNDKAVKRNVIPDASQQKNGGEILPVEQVKAQSHDL